jgi:glycosyltransferase involved in cell wall biosynthesis
VLVSAVIPSRNRPGLVGRAVRSALGQTLHDIEVLVVVDGPDALTLDALACIPDPRLRLISLPSSVGAQEARNIGVREARAPFVAFLDDDDEWLPSKLQRQVEAARNSGFPDPVVSCRLVSRTTQGDVVWPRRDPRPGESAIDYLFVRERSELSEIRLQTSTLLTTRALVLRVPWRRCAHDEWDLLVRASALPGVGLAFVPEPLAIWHSDSGDARLSRQLGTWRRTAEWFRSVHALVGPRAYACFLLSTMSIWARDAGDWDAFFGIPFDALRRGRPTGSALLAHAGRWLLPRSARDALNGAFARARALTGTQKR